MSKYIDRVEEELYLIWCELIDYTTHNNHLTWQWHEWSHGYSNVVTIRKKKPRSLFSPKGWDILIHEIDDDNCVERALEEREDDVIEAIQEANTFIELSKKLDHEKTIDFDVKLKGMNQAIKDLLTGD